MLVSPKDENRSEVVRAEKARLFLEQFIEIEAEWISDWLSMENGETSGAPGRRPNASRTDRSRFTDC